MKVPKRLLRQRVVVRKYLGQSSLGAVYDDPVELPARIKFENKLIRASFGQEIVSDSELMLAADAKDIAVIGSKVLLPGETVERTIESGGPVMGWREITHVRVDLE